MKSTKGKKNRVEEIEANIKSQNQMEEVFINGLK